MKLEAEIRAIIDQCQSLGVIAWTRESVVLCQQNEGGYRADRAADETWNIHDEKFFHNETGVALGQVGTRLAELSTAYVEKQ